jgi:hypothetical protein
VTITQWQQLLFCIAWGWPAGVLTHYSSSDANDIGAGIFWLVLWLFCGWRLYVKGRWPFR